MARKAPFIYAIASRVGDMKILLADRTGCLRLFLSHWFCRTRNWCDVTKNAEGNIGGWTSENDSVFPSPTHSLEPWVLPVFIKDELWYGRSESEVLKWNQKLNLLEIPSKLLLLKKKRFEPNLTLPEIQNHQMAYMFS